MLARYRILCRVRCFYARPASAGRPDAAAARSPDRLRIEHHFLGVLRQGADMLQDKERPDRFGVRDDLPVPLGGRRLRGRQLQPVSRALALVSVPVTMASLHVPPAEDTGPARIPAQLSVRNSG